MSEQCVSSYQIVKEVAEEEGREFVKNGEIVDTRTFNSYKATRGRYLTAQLKKAGLLERYQVKRGDDYQIPLRDKEFVKFLVRSYAEPLHKKARAGKADKITGEDAKALVEKFEKTVLPKVPGEQGLYELSSLCGITQAQSRYALDEAKRVLQAMVERDLGDLTWRPVSKVTKDTKLGKLGKPTDKELRIGNDSDAAFLIRYYAHLMIEQSMIWNQIVDIVDELRTQEICDVADREFEDEGTGDEPIDIAFRDIRSVLFEAREILFERHIDSLAPKPEITEEQKKAVEEILKRKR